MKAENIIAAILCAAVLLMEARGLFITWPQRKWKILVFYNQ